MIDINEKSYGVKVNVISTLDYKDFREILDAIEKLGFKITMVDNGNAVCEKDDGL
jgi:hypothetical protein